MRQYSVTMRVTAGVMLVILCVLLTAFALRIHPDVVSSVRRERATRCEAIAIHISGLATQGNLGLIESSLNALVRRDEDLLSVAVLRGADTAIIDIGDHLLHRAHAEDEAQLSASVYRVPIVAGDRRWGFVEARFRPLIKTGLTGLLMDPYVRLICFTLGVGFLGSFLYMRRTLKHLDPSKVVPTRVRSALDTLTNAVMLMNTEEQIAFANAGFAKNFGREAEQLMGSPASDLPWVLEEDKSDGRGTGAAAPGKRLPWSRAIADGELQIGARLGFRSADSEDKFFVVNSAPILDDHGKNRGALASFEDITNLEKKKQELAEMLAVMRNSRDEIRAHNEQLEVLATQDPLTGCLNRRSFFERFDAQWASAKRHKHPLGCIMFDLDHFKSINDTFGHSMGDDVLRLASQLLRDNIREDDVLCRYGGEEFCILVPHLDIDEVAAAAERYRITLETTEFPHGNVTASIGVSAISWGASDPQAMLDQADKCLYVAKREGRNRVVRWDDVPDDVEVDESKVSRTQVVEETSDPSIPFYAVTALISALAFRDLHTAEHSRRVADLCTATAEGLMSPREIYILEIAALLHDIGKIGTPDDILGKEEPLSDLEWELMRAHDDIGVEIVRAAFASDRLVKVLECRRAIARGRLEPENEQACVGAMILTIADTYDAMTTAQVYRQARSQAEAFAELRQAAGGRFDADIVERFIAVVESGRFTMTQTLGHVTKVTALHIGIEMESLADALEREDIDAIHSLASRLQSTATKFDVAEIGEVAGQLADATAKEPDLLEIVNLTGELLTLCRSTQRAFIDNSELLAAGRSS